MASPLFSTGPVNTYNDSVEKRYHTLEPASGMYHLPARTNTPGFDSPVYTPMFIAHQYNPYVSPDQTFLKQLGADDTNPNFPGQYNISPQQGIYTSQCNLPPSSNQSKSNYILDNELLDLPQDLYIDKLIRLTHESESDISPYRDLLLSRAKLLIDCPNGKLITRRGSRQNPAFSKLAHDCYILQMFLQGEKREIERIFTKPKKIQFPHETGKQGQPHEPENSILKPERSKEFTMEFSQLLTSVMELKSTVSDLQKERQADRKLIDNLRAEIDRIDKENKSLREDVNRNRTIITNNSHSVSQPINDTTSDTSSLPEETVDTKQVEDDVPTYADVVKSAPIKHSKTEMNHEQLDKKPHDKVPPMKFNREKLTWERNLQTHDHPDVNVENPKATSPKVYKKIETVITTERSKSILDKPLTKVFKGKYRGRVKSYYIGGISLDSTDAGIYEYLEERDIEPLELSLFKSKSGDLAAKITVPSYQGYILEETHFWPRFMRCRKWLSRSSWDKYRSETGGYNMYNEQNDYYSENQDHHNID